MDTCDVKPNVLFFLREEKNLRKGEKDVKSEVRILFFLSPRGLAAYLMVDSYCKIM